MTEKLIKLPNPLYPVGIILYSILGLASDMGYIFSINASDFCLFKAKKIAQNKILGSETLTFSTQSSQSRQILISRRQTK